MSPVSVLWSERALTPREPPCRRSRIGPGYPVCGERIAARGCCGACAFPPSTHEGFRMTCANCDSHLLRDVAPCTWRPGQGAADKPVQGAYDTQQTWPGHRALRMFGVFHPG